jgi:hypothetical protein
MQKNTGVLFIDGEDDVIEDETGRHIIEDGGGTGMYSSTGQQADGLSSVFIGSDSYKKIAADTDFDFGSGDFTIDFWVMRTGLGYGGIFTSGLADGSTDYHSQPFSVHDNYGTVEFRMSNTSGNNWEFDVTSCGSITLWSWSHIAIVRSGDTIKTYNNGNLVSTVDVTGFTAATPGAYIEFGRGYSARASTGGAIYFTGFIDNLRVAKEALWTTDFDSTDKEALGYVETDANPNRPGKLSRLYDVTLKRGNRGANAEGYWRPTLSEFFMTDHDYVKTLVPTWDGAYSQAQTINTTGAKSAEYFTIGGDHYLFVANYRNSTVYTIQSIIYKWNGTTFVQHQSITTNGANKAKFFTIGEDSYLGVANLLGNTSYVYKWDGNYFQSFQSFTTYYGVDMEHFTIDGDAYIALANHYDGATRSPASKIYKWNGTNFSEFQSIIGTGAYDWEFFTMEGSHYLALANYYDGTNYANMYTTIYKWNGSTFISQQTITGNAPASIEFFTIGSRQFLAIINHYDGSNYTLNSYIYKWDGSNFVEFQSIPTNGGKDVHSFTIGTSHFVSFLNAVGDDLITYKWNGSSFEIAATLVVGGNTQGHAVFEMDGTFYMVPVMYMDGTSYNTTTPIYTLDVTS